MGYLSLGYLPLSWLIFFFSLHTNDVEGVKKEGNSQVTAH
jgi:hypothetical protein